MGKIIHRFCHYCQNEEKANEPIIKCTDPDCPVYSRRMKGHDKGSLIRKYCLSCVAGSDEIRDCVEDDCIFYSYRFGNLGIYRNKKGNQESLKQFRAVQSLDW